VTRAEGAVDTVITNALIVDWTGIYKADVGLKDGRIVAIGKAGNPDTQPGVDIIIGPGTEAIAGEGKILTAGGFDSAHPLHLPAADRGRADVRRHHHARRRHRPGHGTLATTCTPGPWHIGGCCRRRRLPDEHRPVRQGQRLAPAALEEMILAGACA
jgi:urease subunit alpha